MALPTEGQHVKVHDDDGNVVYCGTIQLLRYGWDNTDLQDGTGWVTMTVTPCTPEP